MYNNLADKIYIIICVPNAHLKEKSELSLGKSVWEPLVYTIVIMYRPLMISEFVLSQPLVRPTLGARELLYIGFISPWPFVRRTLGARELYWVCLTMDVGPSDTWCTGATVYWVCLTMDVCPSHTRYTGATLSDWCRSGALLSRCLEVFGLPYRSSVPS